MKKVLLAVSVMATFGSTAALAQFNNGHESTEGAAYESAIQLSGTITAPSSTWVAYIDESPSGVSNLTSDFSAWQKNKSGSWEYTINAEPLPLVKLRTKSSSVGGYPTPGVTFGSPTQPDAMLSPDGTGEGYSVSVSFMDESGAFIPATDVTLSLNPVVSFSSNTKSDPAAATFRHPGGSSQFSELAKQIADAQLKATRDGVLSESWASLVSLYTNGNKSSQGSQATAAVVGAKAGGFKLVSSRASRPTGAWEARLPVYVTYN